MINVMKQFLNLDDLSNFEQTIIEGIKLKKILTNLNYSVIKKH